MATVHTANDPTLPTREPIVSARWVARTVGAGAVRSRVPGDFSATATTSACTLRRPRTDRRIARRSSRLAIHASRTMNKIFAGRTTNRSPARARVSFPVRSKTAEQTTRGWSGEPQGSVAT